MNSITSDAIPPAEQQRLQTTIENWKRKLLDLSKRNRSLNFKVLNVSTVTIVDELPHAVFSKLLIDGAKMRFAAAEPIPDSSDVAPVDILDELLQVDEQAQPATDLQLELIPPTDISPNNSEPTLYTDTEPEDRHSDNILQTSLDEEKLDRSLRRLDEQTRSALEEQGVNILFLALGMLHYKESPDSAEIFRAPLVLVPVELSRKSSRSGYVLSASGDEAMINPALTEYLRRNHSVSLPELPDAASMADEYDLKVLLHQVRGLVINRKDWEVTEDIYLALFSFQKFMMYKDIEQNAVTIALHRLIRQLIMRTSTQYNGLPQEIKSLELDQSLPPESTFQVVDADSSQLRAIAAVANNFDLVMEGPPGTGKSQTITNLIALALASGRSVLFVAEKNAALKVVHDRLVKAGLGDFCLELHSTKANKRAVVHELARSLDASLHTPTVSASATQRLPAVRSRLTNYIKELHKPFSQLNLSPYQVIGRYDAVIDAPRAKYSGDVESISEEQLTQTIRELNDLADASKLIGDPKIHPWRESSKLYYSEEDFENVDNICKKLLNLLENVHRLSAELGNKLGLPILASKNGLENYSVVSNVVARSPGVPTDVLADTSWDEAPPEEALTLVSFGRDLQQRMEAINLLFKPSVYDSEHKADVTYLEEKMKGLRRLINMLDGRYRSIRKNWLSYRLPFYRGSLRVQAEHLKRVDQINVDRKYLAEQEVAAQKYFGNLWKGENSDWDILTQYIAWVREFRAIYIQFHLETSVIETARLTAPDLSALAQLDKEISNVDEALASLGGMIGWPDGHLDGAIFREMGTRVRGLTEHHQKALHWAAFRTVRNEALEGLGGELVELAMEGQINFVDLTSAFQRAFYQKWLNVILQARKPLLEFNTLLHEQRVTEFKELDLSVLKENRNELIRRVRDDIQRKLQTDAAVQAMPFLRREIARQRGLSPLRRTLKQAGPAIRAIKPCFMMSPLTVAQLLDGSQPGFDLVIFDEASQLPAEDAIGAISRGKQLVVVGDPKQLPPTNFFGVMSGQISAIAGEDGLPAYEDGESILEELMAAGLATSRLKWHYRSAHESLIQFSNANFYDSDLYTFPSVEFMSEDLGVSFEYVENGVYEGKGLNLIEARRVVDAVEKHARTSPHLSLGVGTFNMRQQIAIQDEIENRRRLRPELDAFCSQSNDDPFFVKNLENIQGDERDVIFISVTYAKGIDGRLRYNFGPINGENGWRRLNVLASRARRRMKVFSSIRAEDISLVGLTSGGARLLRNFLAYAESGLIDTTEISKSAEADSPFEHDVYMELTRQGITANLQVGVAGYRIDIGVLDENLPGRYICGIECDGVTYHASETARDRDRLRQQVLEDRGWQIHRIWSTDWFKDRSGQVARILELIKQSREKANADAIARRAAPAANIEVSLNDINEIFDDLIVGNRHPDPHPESDGINPPGYLRPVAIMYEFAKNAYTLRGENILEASIENLAKVIIAVVTIEGPIHIDELVDRIVGFWNTRAGKRIVEQVQSACQFAVQTKLVTKKGEFFYADSGPISSRSRSGLKFIPERISHEEYRATALLVLQTGHVFSRKKIASEVGAILGFQRITGTLEELISLSIDELISTGMAGEASNGIALRRSV